MLVNLFKQGMGDMVLRWINKYSSPEKLGFSSKLQQPTTVFNATESEATVSYSEYFTLIHNITAEACLMMRELCIHDGTHLMSALHHYLSIVLYLSIASRIRKLILLVLECRLLRMYGILSY